MPEIVGRARMPRLSAAPASPVEGEIYYDSVSKCLRVWNGTQWLDGSGAMEQIGNRFFMDGTPANGGGSWPTIPAYYNHLQLRGHVTIASATAVSILRMNGDSGNNYWAQQMWSYAGTPSSANTGWVSYGKCASDLNVQGYTSFVCDILAIRHASQKQWVSSIHGWTTSGSINIHAAGVWNSNAVITSLTFGAGQYMIGEVTLYGIR